MARRVDPRRLRRPSTAASAEDNADLLLQAMHDAAPPVNTAAPPVSTAPPRPGVLSPFTSREAERLRTWGSAMATIGVAGGIIALIIGFPVVSENPAVGVPLVAGGLSAALWWSWLRAWHFAAAEALDVSERIACELETHTELLRQVVQRPAAERSEG